MGALDHFRLDGQEAIATGVSSEFGVKFAGSLAEACSDFVPGAQGTDRLSETRVRIAALDRRCLAVAADVSNPITCAALVPATNQEFGQVDVLVNNAGIGYSAPAHSKSR